jgi:hypothetical protein
VSLILPRPPDELGALREAEGHVHVRVEGDLVSSEAQGERRAQGALE